MNALPLAIEGLVAILLMMTILYCIRLNSQLKRLKADENAMKATVAELLAASETAERAIAGLNATVREADRTLAARLDAAERFSAEIRQGTEAGADVLARLMRIAGAKPWLFGDDEPAYAPAAPRPAAVRPAAPDPKSIVAAAEAIAERARAHVRAVAA